MMTLHGMGSPNVVKVIIMLEEAGSNWAFERIDVMAGEQFDARFRALNPNSKVPALVDADAPGGPLTIFESGAILLYLTERTGTLWPPTLAARAQVNQWLMFQMAGFGPMSGQAIHFTFANREGGYARNRFDNELARLAGVVERRLGDVPFLAGDAYSIADIALFPWVRTLRDFFPAIVDRPNITRWAATISERPAVARALAFGDAVSARDKQAMKDADRGQRDRYFGRVPHPSLQD